MSLYKEDMFFSISLHMSIDATFPFIQKVKFFKMELPPDELLYTLTRADVNRIFLEMARLAQQISNEMQIRNGYFNILRQPADPLFEPLSREPNWLHLLESVRIITRLSKRRIALLRRLRQLQAE